MIRDFKKEDLYRVMELWLDTNISAHSFIDREYWINSYDTVKDIMPNADIYVCEEKEVIQGFIGLIGNYIAGIFISQKLQSKGIGKKLLDYVKTKKDVLSLSVYKENSRAVSFYVRESFIISKEQIDENTNEIELSMNWIK